MRTIIILGLLCFGTALSGCMGESHVDVAASDNAYTPNSLSVKQNELVEWHNEGSNAHTVTIHKVGDPVTTTKKDTNLSPQSATTHKFEETGTYHVYCKYHSSGAAGQFGNGMVMTVTVA